MIPVLGTDKPAVVDKRDADLAERPWYFQNGYAFTRLPAGIRGMHRILLERILGREPKFEEQVDHKDRDGLNNRRSNLRLASQWQNNMNKPKRRGTASKYKGVWKSSAKGRWVAGIWKDGIYTHLGSYPTELDAAYVYDQFALALAGEFAYLNVL